MNSPMQHQPLNCPCYTLFSCGVFWGEGLVGFEPLVFVENSFLVWEDCDISTGNFRKSQWPNSLGLFQ